MAQVMAASLGGGLSRFCRPPGTSDRPAWLDRSLDCTSTEACPPSDHDCSRAVSLPVVLRYDVKRVVGQRLTGLLVEVADDVHPGRLQLLELIGEGGDRGDPYCR